MRIMISGEDPEAGYESLYKEAILAVTPLHITKFGTGLCIVPLVDTPQFEDLSSRFFDSFISPATTAVF